MKRQRTISKYANRLASTKCLENKARVCSSLIVCVAYFITLYIDTTVGARLYLAGNALALPYMMKHKCWDIVALLTFFIVVGMPKVLS